MTSFNTALFSNVHYVKGLLAFRNKDWDAAIRHLEAVLETEPGHSHARFRLGMTHFHVGDTLLAINEIERAIKASPRNVRWQQRLSFLKRKVKAANDKALIKAGEVSEEERLRLMAELKLGGGKTYAQLASIMRKQGKRWQEAEFLKRALEEDSEKSDWQFRLAETLEALRRYQEAGEVFLAALALVPAKEDWAFRAGACFAREGFDGPADIERAEAAFAQAIELDKSGTAARFGVGVFYQKLGRWAEAATAYESKLLEQGFEPELLYRAGLACDRCFMWERAEGHLVKSVVLDPEHGFRHARLGFVQERQGKFKEAANSYEVAIRFGGGEVASWRYRMGQCLRWSGEFESAAQAFLLVHDVPHLVDADSGAGLPPAYQACVDHLSASNELALAADFTSSSKHYVRGIFAERQGDNSLAANAYSAALDRSDDHQPIWYYRLGRVLTRAGRFEEACDAFGRMNLIERAYGGISEAKLNSGRVSRRQTLFAEFYENCPLNEQAIVYEAFHGEAMSCNPLAIFKYLLKSEGFGHFKHIWVVNDHRRIPAEFRTLENVVFVSRQSDGYVRALATSKYLVTNVTFPEYFVRRDEQVYLNTWHGTPIKGLGKDIPDEFFAHTNIARNFLQASHLLSPNRHTSNVMLDSYDIRQLFRAEFAETGYPRIDETVAISDQDRKELRQKLGVLQDEKIVFYAPTWRGLHGKAVFDTDHLKADLAAMDLSGAKVFFRGHHYMEKLIQDLDIEFGIVPEEVNSNLMLSVTDVLVTDYSSIAIDFIPRRKPIIYYAYDLEEYTASRNMYFALEDLPGKVCRDRSSMRNAIQRALDGHDATDWDRAVAQFASYDDGKVTERVVDWVFRGKRDGIDFLPHDSRKSVVMFGGQFIPNGITSSLLNLMSHVDTEDVSYTLLVEPNQLADFDDRLDQFGRLSKDLPIVGIIGSKALSLEEDWADSKLNSSKTLASDALWELLERGYRREFRRVLGGSSVDVLVSFDGYTRYWLLFAAFAPSGSVSRKVIYQHNDMKEEWKKRFPYLESMFQIYDKADKLISVSKTMRDINAKELEKEFGIPRSKFDFVENAHNPEVVHSSASQKISKVHQNLFAGPGPVFVTMGRLSIEKDQSKLVRAFASVTQTFPAAKLLLLGDGPLRHEVKATIEELKLGGSVHMLGQQSNPFPYLAKSDCFVLPSNHEGQPMVLLEALILGKPIIATDIPGNRGALQGRGGVLVPNSEAGLAKAMIEFAHNPKQDIQFDVELYQKNAIADFSKKVIGLG